MAPADLYDNGDYLYDGNDYDEGQEEQLSPEDKAAMEQGTADVKKSLGANANKVTIQQIEEALWHYYYDVDKSVAYLNKTFIAPPPKVSQKTPPDSKFIGFCFSPRLGLFVRSTGADPGLSRATCPQAAEALTPLPSATGYSSDSMLGQQAFHDMPWLSVPKDRQATLLPPAQPPGGLLGGGERPPKVSKLQALAAARKKKNDEKKEHETAFSAECGIKRLSIADDSQKENKVTPIPVKRRRGPDNGAIPSISTNTGDIEPSHEGHPMSQSEVANESTSTCKIHPSISGPSSASDQGVAITPGRAVPSAFARAILESAPDSRRANRPEFYVMPYASSSSFLASAFSGPSPDDIVLTAQAKAGKKTGPSAKKKASPAAKKPQKSDATIKEADVEQDLSNLKVGDVPLPKSKGLDVVKEYKSSNSKKSISFVVVGKSSICAAWLNVFTETWLGHVDAGKSTLMGRLLLELKYVQERTVNNYRRKAEKSGKQSFALAWVLDQRTEERERGVTIDIATNHFETPNTRFTILDAPGHRDFVPNMIAGASQADFAILVIDANTGAYEKGLKGQTREHVLLLRSLGVQRLIVAVNKLDMVGWSKERFDEISQQVTGFLAGLGFQHKLISFVPISGLNGDNIATKTTEAAAAWYQGSTLIEALEATEPSSSRAISKPFRMTISEAFRSQQGTTTLAGRIDAGNIQIGDRVLVQPSGESAYIKSIMTDAESQEWAVAGQSISIALTDIDPIHIRVGDILCGVASPISVGDTFTMKAMAFEHLMPMPVDLHRGRLHAAGQIQSIPATLNKATGEIVKKKPKVVQPGEVARITVKLASKVPLEKGQRVVVRSGGETIAAGLLE
ncbi:hypothetical protein UVI_02045340 [Ustilaginoidea virens]|uniref:Elongation factor 1 alpha-like protein n=1 Tax=Ustilaginoidea virens TaxID=1159556 RepID=A0A1B5KYL1_USTVR|nr:hypothetical protein UVI_02045340 [Ustilaginoidea virens]